MIFLLLFLFSFILRQPIFAENEFKFDQTILYDIDRSGNAIVDQKTLLINNFSEIYVKEFQINLSGNEISDIKATDNQGNILESVSKQNQDTLIKVKFNDSNVGKNKTTSFNVNYRVNGFATKKGNTWEISLPQFNLNSEDNILVELSIPSTFGSLSFSSVTPKRITELNQSTKITLDSQTLKNSKILFVFGNSQVFDMDLKYYLSNETKDIVNTEIALPPDTDSQHIIYSKIDPPPLLIKKDDDGNWLAQYQLKPSQNIEVSVLGQAKIHPAVYTTPVDINPEKYLASDKFWTIDSPEIKNISQSLTTPKQVYDYVVTNLSYDYSAINNARRKGALLALQSPSNSLCTEFTDLFVTIGRASGIPAREVEGYAYTNNPKIKPTNENTDILHAWPQYYDIVKKRWISVDPTWEKTTNGIDYFRDMDLNHIAFVFHGLKSDYPPPPGSYKNNRTAKTVIIDFAKNELQDSFIPPKIDIPKNSLTTNPTIIVTNTNFNRLPKAIITVPKTDIYFEISDLPPLGQHKITLPSVNFIQSLLPKYQRLNFVVETPSGQKANYSTIYPPHYFNLAITLLSLIFLLSIGGIILTSKKR